MKKLKRKIEIIKNNFQTLKIKMPFYLAKFKIRNLIDIINEFV